jgi:CBS domain containing-hemolysin-like protein
MVEAHVRLNFDNMLEIYKSGYTRIPVYDTQPQAIIGILYTKDLILVDPGARPAAAARTYPNTAPTLTLHAHPRV